MVQSCPWPVSPYCEPVPDASLVRAITLAGAVEIDGGCDGCPAFVAAATALRSTSLGGAGDVLDAEAIAGSTDAAEARVVVSGFLQTSRDDPPASSRDDSRGNETVGVAASDDEGPMPVVNEPAAAVRTELP